MSTKQPPELIHARTRLARANMARFRDDTKGLEDARRDYIAAKLEAYVREVVDSAPRLTDDQPVRIAVLLTRGTSDSA